MKVKLVVQLSGTRDGADWPPVGSVVDLPDVEARNMVDAGIAVETDDAQESDVETAITEPAGVERAVTTETAAGLVKQPARRARAPRAK